MLEIKNLSVNYGVITALQQVSLAVKQGDIVTLIGGNGRSRFPNSRRQGQRIQDDCDPTIKSTDDTDYWINVQTFFWATLALSCSLGQQHRHFDRFKPRSEIVNLLIRQGFGHHGHDLV